MANMSDSTHFKTHDDYYTPQYVWEDINHLIPAGSIIWEACMLNADKSKSPEYLKSLSNVKDVIYNTKMDMLKGLYTENMYDMIITNIPFGKDTKQDILKRLVEIDKPFIIIINGLNIYSKYIRKIFGDKLKYLQVIHPDKKIHYDKLENGEIIKTNKCSFYSVYLAYRMDLSAEKLWL